MLSTLAAAAAQVGGLNKPLDLSMGNPIFQALFPHAWLFTHCKRNPSCNPAFGSPRKHEAYASPYGEISSQIDEFLTCADWTRGVAQVRCNGCDYAIIPPVFVHYFPASYQFLSVTCKSRQDLAQVVDVKLDVVLAQSIDHPIESGVLAQR